MCICTILQRSDKKLFLYPLRNNESSSECYVKFVYQRKLYSNITNFKFYSWIIM